MENQEQFKKALMSLLRHDRLYVSEYNEQLHLLVEFAGGSESIGNRESPFTMDDFLKILEGQLDSLSNSYKPNEIVYFDMDGVLADFDSRLKEINPYIPGKDDPGRKDAVEAIECQPGFYRSLKPIPGAIDAFKAISKVYETYILSTASWENVSCWSEKREWVQEYLGETGYKKLILSHHKGLLKGDYLIDDRIKNGVDKFEGEHIHFGTEKFPDWNSVLRYLL